VRFNQISCRFFDNNGNGPFFACMWLFWPSFADGAKRAFKAYFSLTKSAS
jgi:hypothetical protein